MNTAQLENPSLSLPGRLLLNGLRILIGYMWFTQTQWKMPPDWGCGAARDRGLCDWIQREIDYPLIPLYHDFLVGFVQPNLSWFGGVVYFTELFIAISLILGLLTKLGALTGAMIGVNLTIGLWNVPHEWYWAYIFLVCLQLLFFLTNAGRPFGLDQFVQPWLAPKIPKALRWLV